VTALLIPTHFVEVEGRRHRISLGGTGTPAVVFEPAIGDVGLTWGLVLPEVARITTAFTHDRPGLGDSEPSNSPRTVDVMVDGLRHALAAAEVGPPYVLVGHSFSSLTVQAFAYLHPDEVKGIVLIDGAHEDQMERFPSDLSPRAMLAGVPAQLRQLAETARRGKPVPELVPVPERFPEPLAKAYREATAPTPDRLETAAGEFDGLEQSQAQVRSLSKSSLGEIPLVAIRHGVPQSMPGVPDEVNERYEAAWQEIQDELAARSNSGRVIVAEGAGHMIHHDRPDLVVEGIRGLMG
jgi:pimeloyl-ACP methyl ester carboxylesterase